VKGLNEQAAAAGLGVDVAHGAEGDAAALDEDVDALGRERLSAVSASAESSP